MTDQKINLPQALLSDAEAIWNYLGAVKTNVLQPNEFRRPIHYNWPSANTVEFRQQDTQYDIPEICLLTNIHVTEWEDIRWEEEHQIGTRDVSSNVADLTLLFAATRDFEFTFGETRSLKEASVEAFKTEVTLRLGSETTPVGAKIQQEIEKSFSKEFGSQATQSNTVRQGLTFSDHGTYQVKAVRTIGESQRVIRGKPIFDYSIKVIRNQPDNWEVGGYYIEFSSKQEFLEFIQGNAPDNVGVLHGRGFSNPLSGLYRNSPDRGARLPEHYPEITRLVKYDSYVRDSVVQTRVKDIDQISSDLSAETVAISTRLPGLEDIKV